MLVLSGQVYAAPWVGMSVQRRCALRHTYGQRIHTCVVLRKRVRFDVRTRPVRGTRTELVLVTSLAAGRYLRLIWLTWACVVQSSFPSSLTVCISRASHLLAVRRHAAIVCYILLHRPYDGEKVAPFPQCRPPTAGEGLTPSRHAAPAEPGGLGIARKPCVACTHGGSGPDRLRTCKTHSRAADIDGRCRAHGGQEGWKWTRVLQGI